MIKILAHRGYWNESLEKNSPQAIKTALENGYGFESDIRDYMGDLVISHNIADETCQRAKEVFRWLHEYGDRYTFAINIKADGLKTLLKKYMDEFCIRNYFLFDMSVPQMVEFKEIGLRFFTRQSEVEPVPNMYDDAAGVWIDGFWDTDWITEEILLRHIRCRKEICLVSPDLHGSSCYRDFWGKLRQYDIDLNMVMLCTDHPDEAKEYFNE